MVLCTDPSGESYGREYAHAVVDQPPRNVKDGLISIVIVNWNTVDFLRKCLSSILSGTRERAVEIIVVDNGSSDGSQDAVRNEFPTVVLIQNESNLGFAKANNIGVQRATGKYICLINSDVVVHEGCLDRMSQYMDQNASIGVLGPRILNPDSTLQPSCREFPGLWNSTCRALALDALLPGWPLFGGYLMTYWSHDTPLQVEVLSGCFWMVRRETMDQVGRLDEDFYIYGEDIDFCKRCRIQNWELVYYPEATALHYGGASSARFPVRFELENLKAILQYWQKHHGRSTLALYKGIRFWTHLRRAAHGAVCYPFQPARRKSLRCQMKVNWACVLWLLWPSNPYVIRTREEASS